MKRMILICSCGLLLGVALVVAIYWYTYARLDYSAIDYIYSLQKGPNAFADLGGDIGVTSIDDVGYEQKGNYDLTIHYGKQIIKINKTALHSDEYKRRLAQIGISIQQHVDNETGDVTYRVLYWKEPIELWSLVTGT